MSFIVTAGLRHDSTQVIALITGLRAWYVITYIESQGATLVIPPRAGRP